MFWGRSSDLQNDPNLQVNINFQAGPINKSSVLQDGWGTFASRLSQYKFKSSVFQMSGDALRLPPLGRSILFVRFFLEARMFYRRINGEEFEPTRQNPYFFIINWIFLYLEFFFSFSLRCDSINFLYVLFESVTWECELGHLQLVLFLFLVG